MDLRLAMQAVLAEDFLALSRLGMATAASTPMIATTIMISIRVKPLELVLLRCIGR
jgi:hypothetical protein